ncbi:hypothetical protein ECC02_007532 [Trypanosoma cruzi]|uniref:Uncharacterized protein n=2 Tax=Trypanosoma cruzi TaxID=5693 RepID=A0A7J6XYJ4_TRYCR|nr:hypothetical protein ECC02_007532 [Trypanosoma cruzi]
MSRQAVGWLSSKLGINIDGRTETEEKTDSALFPSHGFSSAAMKIDMCLHKINDAVFGRDSDSGAGGESNFIGGSSGVGATSGGEEVELDENGLPITKNWYYFDKELNRWNVSPEAPAAIKEEYERRLKEDEDEREGRNFVPPPPLPPPPAPPLQPFVGEHPSMYPRGGLFPTGAPPTPQQQQQNQQHGTHPQGLFGIQSSMGTPHHRPQYAMPKYFDLSTSAPHIPTTNPTTPHISTYVHPQPQPQEHQHQGQQLHPHQPQPNQESYQQPGVQTQFIRQQQEDPYQQHEQRQTYKQQHPLHPQVPLSPPTSGYDKGEPNQLFHHSFQNSVPGHPRGYPY